MTQPAFDEALEPTELIALGGSEFHCRPIVFSQFAVILQHLEPLLNDLKEPSDGVRLSDLISRHTTALAKAACYWIGKPQNFLDELPMEEVEQLIEVFWKLNSDFFVKRVLPKVFHEETLKMLVQLNQQFEVGQTPYNS